MAEGIDKPSDLGWGQIELGLQEFVPDHYVRDYFFICGTRFIVGRPPAKKELKTAELNKFKQVLFDSVCLLGPPS